MTDEEVRAEVKKALHKIKWGEAVLWGAFLIVVVVAIIKL